METKQYINGISYKTIFIKALGVWYKLKLGNLISACNKYISKS